MPHKYKNSSGDERNVNPYQRRWFYTEHWFSITMRNVVPKTKAFFEKREREEQKQRDRLVRPDLINWRLGAKNN